MGVGVGVGVGVCFSKDRMLVCMEKPKMTLTTLSGEHTFETFLNLFC